MRENTLWHDCLIIGGHITYLIGLGTIFFAIYFWWVFELRSYPPTTRLADQYLHAVLARNENRATRLAGSGCEDSVRLYARADINRFGGAEIRNVAIEVKPMGGSDEEMERALIKFEYRKNNQAAWQSGKVGLMTDFEGLGLRHLICGG